VKAPRRIPDAERTATMLDLVRRRYEGDHEEKMSLSHVVVEEVAPSTGFNRVSRWADVLVLSMWRSNGLTLDGYEIKASRADLKKELADPSKAEALARYCDSWTLIAWDDAVLVEGVPESWGIITTVDGEYGRELTQQRKAVTRTPEPWPRTFVCSLVRNAYQQSPGAAFVARACLEARDKSFRAGKDAERGEWKHALHPLAAALYGNNSWHWPAEAHDHKHLLKVAVERLAQGSLTLEVTS
jgi:hypothetical protein